MNLNAGTDPEIGYTETVGEGDRRIRKILDDESGGVKKENTHHKMSGQTDVKASANSTYYCIECDVDCKTARAYHSHTRGMLHTQKMMNTQSTSSATTPQNTQSNIPQLTSNMVQPNNYAASSVEMTRTSQQEPPQNDTKTDEYFCTVCQINCNNPKAYQNHTRGLIHTQKVMEMERMKGNEILPEEPEKLKAGEEKLGMRKTSQGTFKSVKSAEEDADSYTCEICECTMTGIVSYASHMEGARHAKNVKNRAIGARIKRGRTGKVVLVTDKDRPRYQYLIDSCGLPLIGLQHVTEFVTESVQIDPRYVCNLCESKCDINSLIAHCTGSKHRMHYMKEHFMHYYTNVKHKNVRRSELSSIVESFAKRIENEEGRKSIRQREVNDALLLEKNAKNIISMTNITRDGFPDARPPPGAFSFGDNEGIPPKRQRYEPPGEVLPVGPYASGRHGLGQEPEGGFHRYAGRGEYREDDPFVNDPNSSEDINRHPDDFRRIPDPREMYEQRPVLNDQFRRDTMQPHDGPGFDRPFAGRRPADNGDRFGNPQPNFPDFRVDSDPYMRNQQPLMEPRMPSASGPQRGRKGLLPTPDFNSQGDQVKPLLDLPHVQTEGNHYGDRSIPGEALGGPGLYPPPPEEDHYRLKMIKERAMADNQPRIQDERYDRYGRVLNEIYQKEAIIRQDGPPPAQEPDSFGRRPPEESWLERQNEAMIRQDGPPLAQGPDSFARRPPEESWLERQKEAMIRQDGPPPAQGPDSFARRPPEEFWLERQKEAMIRQDGPPLAQGPDSFARRPPEESWLERQKEAMIRQDGPPPAQGPDSFGRRPPEESWLEREKMWRKDMEQNKPLGPQQPELRPGYPRDRPMDEPLQGSSGIRPLLLGLDESQQPPRNLPREETSGVRSLLGGDFGEGCERNMVADTRQLKQQPDISSMLDNLTQCLVNSEEDAAMALQVSNALTQALIEYRLKNTPGGLPAPNPNAPL